MGSTDLVFNRLPNELIVRMFQYLPVDDLVRCMRVCKTWNAWLQESDYLWVVKLKQLHLTQKAVQLPRQIGDRSVKEQFMMLYKESLVKKNWFSGQMYKISAYSDLPSNSICPMDVEVWGEILEQELLR